MPKSRLDFQNIRSWTPSIDPRAIAEGTTFVLDGRNYLFDSKGPFSAFGSRLLHDGNPIVSAENISDVQSLGGFIFTTVHIGRFDVNGTWIISYVFPTAIAGADVRRRWTRVFLDGVAYFCHPAIGIIKYEGNAWSAVNPGISLPQAIAETNGRLVVLGDLAIAWSGPGSPEDFVPALGGAGFITIASRIAGIASILIGLPQGIIAWTDHGGLVGEFTGDDEVFRWYILPHKHIPLSDMAIVQVADGSYVMCTLQGIFRQPLSGTPEPLTPVFNEWLRETLIQIPLGGLHVRLDYARDEDRLYVQLSDWSQGYTRTYPLSLALDKWGSFDISHFGIIEHGISTEPALNRRGYVDTNSVAHRFVSYDTKREITLGVYAGLDSEIILGPLRVPDLAPTIDALQEVQGITLGQHARPLWSQEVQLTLDLNLDGPTEDMNSLPNQNEDTGSTHDDAPNVSFGLTLVGDLSGYDSQHPLDIDSELEGILVEIPALIRETAHTRFYSCLTNGVWHRLHVTALGINEYFHVTFGQINVSYYGRTNT